GVLTRRAVASARPKANSVTVERPEGRGTVELRRITPPHRWPPVAPPPVYPGGPRAPGRRLRRARPLARRPLPCHRGGRERGRRRQAAGRARAGGRLHLRRRVAGHGAGARPPDGAPPPPRRRPLVHEPRQRLLPRDGPRRR